ncbi:MAG: ABC transporter permease [Paracoccaceae bacterium]|nr:ABC transporter permease [Paracoccaceae bacterium]MDE2912857.1 ABC transporter permease [Paracoccaceae bacterium]
MITPVPAVASGVRRGAFVARWLRQNVYLVAGAFILLSFLFAALFGEQIAPYGADRQNLLKALEGPSSAHWLGTDPLGRDLLSRVVIGTRHTLSVALISVGLSCFLGVLLGLISGFMHGPLATVVDAVVDVALTIPNMILAISIAAVMGAGLTGLIMAISISFTPPIARIVRGRVMEIREEDFIAAARTIGVRSWRILLRHVLPNASTVIVIEASLQAGQAVLTATALGFLGLGVQPPTPEWGTLLGSGREYLHVAPFMVVAPGLAISLMVLGFNLLGDGLRDWLDPRVGN